MILSHGESLLEDCLHCVDSVPSLKQKAKLTFGALGDISLPLS